MTDRELTAAMVKALRQRYAPPEWAFISELATRSGWNASRLDGWAYRCWQAHPGHESIGFEIKASRADFLREKRTPKWSGYLDVCDRFYFVVADGVTNVNEFADRFEHDGYLPGLIRFTPGQGLRTIQKARRIRGRRGAEEWPMFSRPFLASVIRSALLTDPPFNPYTGTKGRRV